MLCGTWAIAPLPRSYSVPDHRLTVNQQLTLGREQQAHQYIERRALAAAGASDKPHAHPFADRQIQIVEHPGPATGIAKATPR